MTDFYHLSWIFNWAAMARSEGPAPAEKRPCPGCQRRPCNGTHARCDIMRFSIDECLPPPTLDD